MIYIQKKPVRICSFSFQPIDSRMYVIMGKTSAVVIDPFRSQEAVDFLTEENVHNITVILTHEHYDHISGVNWIRGQFECKVIASVNCSLGLHDPNINMSDYYEVLFMGKSEDMVLRARESAEINYKCYADETFSKKMELEWEENSISLIETPGHSKGSICIFFNSDILFTGDSLVNGNKIITRLPGGSRQDYLNITKPFLTDLPENIKIMPGHGDADYLSAFLSQI